MIKIGKKKNTFNLIQGSEMFKDN